MKNNNFENFLNQEEDALNLKKEIFYTFFLITYFFGPGFY